MAKQSSAPTEIQLPELCRAGLGDLYQKAKAAEHLYNVALNAAITALGLDPKGNHRFNLDTGVVVPAQPAEPDEPKQADPA